MNHPPVTMIDATAVLKELQQYRDEFRLAAGQELKDTNTARHFLAEGIADGLSLAISTIKIAQADAYATAVKEGAK